MWQPMECRGGGAADKKGLSCEWRRSLGAFGREPKIDLLIEAVDKVTFQALVAKEQQGTLRLAERSLHIELPRRRIPAMPG